jgi:cbb3-type cytochrome oxidase cytochrome c subunit
MALFGAMPVESAQEMARASDMPCYERNIQPLIEERCASCHSQGSQNMRTYETAKSHAYGIYREVMSGNKNMQGRLTSAEKKLFEAWHIAGEPRCQDPNRKK